MSQTLFLAIIAAQAAFNLCLIIAAAVIVLRRTKASSARCAEENRKEREAAAAEYKALAEKTTQAMVQISVAIGDLRERLPAGSKAHDALTKRVATIDPPDL